MAGRRPSEHLSNRCRYKDTTCLSNQRQLLLFRGTGQGPVLQTIKLAKSKSKFTNLCV